jgi:hypothetical protein
LERAKVVFEKFEEIDDCIIVGTKSFCLLKNLGVRTAGTREGNAHYE